MSRYIDKLKHPKWIKLSKEIKQRDAFMCVLCKSSKKLQVHHKLYVNGRLPWEYHHDYLVTLCEECHKKQHDEQSIENFVTMDRKLIKASNPNKKKNKCKRWLSIAMSTKDNERMAKAIKDGKHNPYKYVNN